MSILTDLAAKATSLKDYIVHIVDPTDATQNGAGSGFNITLENLRQGILDTSEITAFPTGGQADAIVLSSYKNYTTVCATADDSLKMPPAILNLSVFHKNKGANSARLFPNETENFDGLAADAHIDFPVGGAGIMFTCHTAGTWEVEI